MQLLEHWDPLNMPRGSVRAIVALALLGVLWAQMLLGREVSVIYASLVPLILSHYFGSRNLTRSREAEGVRVRSALGLPRGTIRTLIIAGFAAVTFLLWKDGRLRFDPIDRNTSVLILIGALIAGFLVRGAADLVSGGKPTTPRRWFENAKSALTLAATAMLAIVAFIGSESTETHLAALAGALIVGFYFGSRY